MMVNQVSIKDDEVVEQVYGINNYYCKQMIGDIRLMGPLYRGTIRDGLNNGELLYFVDDGVVKGFVMFEKLKKTMVLNLDKLAVLSDCRGCGIGTRLLDMVKEIANEENRILRVRVSRVNDMAVKFYIKNEFGFVGKKDYKVIMEWMKIANVNEDEVGQVRLVEWQND